jgi:hypothetical protein
MKKKKDLCIIWLEIRIQNINYWLHGGGERCAEGSGGETWGKETSGETQT